jgi:hypothetical protein
VLVANVQLLPDHVCIIYITGHYHKRKAAGDTW